MPNRYSNGLLNSTLPLRLLAVALKLTKDRRPTERADRLDRARRRLARIVEWANLGLPLKAPDS